MSLKHFPVKIREGIIPIATNNIELPWLNFVERRSELNLIPSLILPCSSFICFNFSNIVKPLGTTNIFSSFANSLQESHITKHDINTLLPTLNFSIVNNSSFNLITIFTGISSTKGRLIMIVILWKIISLFFNYLSSSIITNPIINVITVPPKIWREKPTNKYKY